MGAPGRILRLVCDTRLHDECMTEITTPARSANRRPLTTAGDDGPQRLGWQFAAIAAVWTTCLAVVALWVAGGGAQALGMRNADSLASLSRITGLISANLLLLQVLLMVRVPLFERGFGRSGITRMHRLTGMWSFSLLLAHIVLIAIAYAWQDGVNLFAEAWDLLVNYPGVLVAAIGVGFLILVMATSARRARRRLRYETWHLLHLYAYLGVALAIPHMLLTGNDFVNNPLATAYWWTLWGAAAGCVLVFRLLLPYWRSRRHALRIVEVVRDGSRGVTVRMRGRRLDLLRARAGQHFVWRFLDGPGWSRGHPFSLSAAPTGDALQITARIVGDGTERLSGLQPGTRVLIEGPYGSMTGDRRTAPQLLMFAAGAGVAPLVALLEASDFAPGEAVLVTRDTSDDEQMLRSSIGRLVTERGLLHYAMNGPRATWGSTWLPRKYAEWDGADMVHHLAPGALAESEVYLCGPTAWMTALRADLLRAGVRPARIHSEFFTTDRSEGVRS